MGLDEQIEVVTKVCDVAGKEFAIEQAMDKMEGEWQGVNLEIVAYRETGTFVLKGFDVIQALLDDHIVMTQSMSFSPFKGPFAQRIDDWEKLLTLMSEIFEEWIKVPARVDVPRADLLVGRHHAPAADRGQALPGRRPHVAQAARPGESRSGRDHLLQDAEAASDVCRVE